MIERDKIYSSERPTREKGGNRMVSLKTGIKEWLEQYKRNSVKMTTYDRLETSYNALLRHPIADVSYDELTTDDIQNYLNDLVRDGYALTTIRKQYFLIRAYLDFLLTKGLINLPVYKMVKLPVEAVVKKHRKEVVCYTKDEQEALVDVLETRERPAYALTELILETGLRIGEGIALKWDDILWRRRAVSINKTMIRIANRRMMLVQNGAKSKTSNRVIPLSETAYRLLSEMYEEAEDKRGYIFVNRYGEPLSYESVRYQIHFACAKAGVPYLGMHAFRHTFATNCYERGCDVKILSKLLGHSDVAITYNIYIHLYGDALEEMRRVVG